MDTIPVKAKGYQNAELKPKLSYKMGFKKKPLKHAGIVGEELQHRLDLSESLRSLQLSGSAQMADV